MSGIEKIIERLNEECDVQCAEILSAAEEKAAAVTARAQAEGNETIRAYETEAQAKAAQTVTRAASAASLDDRRAALQVRAALVDETLAAAKSKLCEDTDAYFAALRTLALRYARPQAGTLCFGKKDLARLPADFMRDLPAETTLSPEPAPIADGFLLKYGGIEINCTLDALFAAARDDLKLKAAQLLFD